MISHYVTTEEGRNREDLTSAVSTSMLVWITPCTIGCVVHYIVNTVSRVLVYVLYAIYRYMILVNIWEYMS